MSVPGLAQFLEDRDDAELGRMPRSPARQSPARQLVQPVHAPLQTLSSERAPRQAALPFGATRVRPPELIRERRPAPPPSAAAPRPYPRILRPFREDGQSVESRGYQGLLPSRYRLLCLYSIP